MGKICVIGSLNIDLTITIPHFHAPGETIIGTSFETFTGGKGGNQAVASARLGAETSIVGLVGRDAYGETYRRVLASEGVDVQHLLTSSNQPTGIALIEVDERTGDNRIALAPGANSALSADALRPIMDSLLMFDIFLLQLEIPLETNIYLAEVLRNAGKCVILDPAPAQPLPDALLRNVDYLTPNESELSLLTNQEIRSYEDTVSAAESLRRRGVSAVIAKMGEKGAMLLRDVPRFAPAYKVAAIDTTAAGDSFNAGFAVGLSLNMGEPDALSFANAAGALATTALGAQAAMGAYDEVIALMTHQNLDGM